MDRNNGVTAAGFARACFGFRVSLFDRFWPLAIVQVSRAFGRAISSKAYEARPENVAQSYDSTRAVLTGSKIPDPKKTDRKIFS